MSLTFPEHLQEKIRTFGESSYGATRVILVLADVRRVASVYVAWGSDIVKVGARMISSADELGFQMSDIVDVLNETPR